MRNYVHDIIYYLTKTLEFIFAKNGFYAFWISLILGCYCVLIL